MLQVSGVARSQACARTCPSFFLERANTTGHSDFSACTRMEASKSSSPPSVSICSMLGVTITVLAFCSLIAFATCTHSELSYCLCPVHLEVLYLLLEWCNYSLEIMTVSMNSVASRRDSGHVLEVGVWVSKQLPPLGALTRASSFWQHCGC